MELATVGILGHIDKQRLLNVAVGEEVFDVGLDVVQLKGALLDWLTVCFIEADVSQSFCVENLDLGAVE